MNEEEYNATIDPMVKSMVVQIGKLVSEQMETNARYGWSISMSALSVVMASLAMSTDMKKHGFIEIMSAVWDKMWVVNNSDGK